MDFADVRTIMGDAGTALMGIGRGSGTVQYSTIQYSTVQYSTVQYSTIQYSTVQYSTVQYSTVQYKSMPCPSMQCPVITVEADLNAVMLWLPSVLSVISSIAVSYYIKTISVQ